MGKEKTHQQLRLPGACLSQGVFSAGVRRPGASSRAPRSQTGARRGRASQGRPPAARGQRRRRRRWRRRRRKQRSSSGRRSWRSGRPAATGGTAERPPSFPVASASRTAARALGRVGQRRPGRAGAVGRQAEERAARQVSVAGGCRLEPAWGPRRRAQLRRHRCRQCRGRRRNPGAAAEAQSRATALSACCCCCCCCVARRHRAGGAPAAFGCGGRQGGGSPAGGRAWRQVDAAGIGCIGCH